MTVKRSSEQQKRGDEQPAGRGGELCRSFDASTPENQQGNACPGCGEDAADDGRHGIVAPR